MNWGSVICKLYDPSQLTSLFTIKMEDDSSKIGYISYFKPHPPFLFDFFGHPPPSPLKSFIFDMIPIPKSHQAPYFHKNERSLTHVDSSLVCRFS